MAGVMAKYCIHIGNQIYSTDNRQPIIDAIPDSEVIKGCLKGVCRVCRCRLVSGRVLENGKEIISNTEFLPCISRAETDVEITPTISNFQPAIVKKKRHLSKKILEIVLEVRTVFYNAKSIVTLKHPTSSAVRSYSIVSLGKRRYDTLTLHVKLRPGGLFSGLLENITVGETLEYMLVNPQTPQYETLIQSVNVVSGGSGMGAALSRAQELVTALNIKKVSVYAINRTGISDYHTRCINKFIEHTACEVNIVNIPFQKWVCDLFKIREHLRPGALTIGVGSELVINRLQNIPLCELESFG